MNQVAMLPKVVILLTCLYVAKAGVLTVNAYADDNYEVESAHENVDTLDRSVRNCVNSQCNNICRALGFASGVCISPTVCRCSGRSAQDTAVPEINQGIDQDHEEVVVRTTRSCETSECTRFCQRMGYARGVCIGTYCQCRSRAASFVSRLDTEQSSDDHDAQSAFLNAISPEADNGNTSEDTLDRSVRSCVNSQCNNVCRALGFARGICISSTVCRCSGRRMAQDASFEDKNSEKSVTSDELDQAMINDDGADTLERSVRSCVNSQCNNVCRALGFARGVCISSTVCRCSGRRMAQHTASEASKTEETASFDELYQAMENYGGADTLDRSVRSCVNSQCNNVCRALGFARGVCISPTVCRCSGRRMAQDVLPEAKTSEEAASFDDVHQDMNVYDNVYTLDRSVRRCVNSQCNNICRSLGFARGVCISSTVCRCTGRRTAKDSLPEAKTGEEAASFDDVHQDMNVYDDAYSLDRSVRSCVNSQCNNFCRSLGFARGVCISSTRCRCSGRRTAQDALPEAKTGEEVASFNDVHQDMNVYDDAYTLDRSVRNCVNSQCNNICRSLGFARGVCISPTVCRCSGRRMAQDDSFAAFEAQEANDVEDKKGNCNLRWCEQTCRRMGYPGGACVNGRCKCDLRSSPMPDSVESNDIAETKMPRACNLRWCEQTCRRMGYPGGACVNGRCKCDIRRIETLLSAQTDAVSANDDSGSASSNAVSAKEEESNDIPQN